MRYQRPAPQRGMVSGEAPTKSCSTRKPSVRPRRTSLAWMLLRYSTAMKSWLACHSNCWAIAHARRAGVLIDGENYFRALYQALKKARRSILIAGPNFVEADLETRLSTTGADDSDRLVGSLVHRLLQREGLAADVVRARDDDWVIERLGSLVRVEESIAIADRDAVIRRAAAAYRAFSGHEELRALYLSGTAFHEVPFSLSIDDRVVRGTIDCLVQKSDGDVAVLEFKTGRRRPEHEAQAALYEQAAAALFPGCRVVTQLLYAADAGIS